MIVHTRRIEIPKINHGVYATSVGYDAKVTLVALVSHTPLTQTYEEWNIDFSKLTGQAAMHAFNEAFAAHLGEQTLRQMLDRLHVLGIDPSWPVHPNALEAFE